MRYPLVRLRAATVALLALSGCVTTLPEGHVLGVLVPDGEEIELTVLERGVSGQHCGSTAGSSGDVGEAVNEALAAVAGANVLVDASVYTRQRLDRVCVEVRGNAAALY